MMRSSVSPLWMLIVGTVLVIIALPTASILLLVVGAGVIATAFRVKARHS